MKKTILTIFCISALLCVTGCEKVESPSADSKAPESSVTTEESVPEADDETVADDTDSSDDEVSGGNVSAAELGVLFREETEAGSDLKATADKIAAHPELKVYDLVPEKCSEGFLSGFSEDVTGFTDGYCMQPVIGSIPLAIYVFESDDAEALKEKLDSLANPAWNICTEAGDVHAEVSGNRVFYAFLPGEEG